MKGNGGSFFKEPAKYLLEEINVTLNDKGKGQFKITTTEEYKKKIEVAKPATIENPNPKAELIFTLEMPTGGNGAISFSENMPLKNGKPVGGTKFIEVLDGNETLTLTNEQKIKSIVFSTEDGKNVQQTLTKDNAKHKIWVHTVNMIDVELAVDVMTNVCNDSMIETNGVIAAMQSIENYPSEKVGTDGLLELDFNIETKHFLNAESNPVRFNIQVSKKVKDPADDKKEIFIFVADQLIQTLSDVKIMRSEDLKTIGIKASKQDGTAFSEEEKVALRKRSLSYLNTALMVERSGLTPEATQNCDVFVEVDEMAEIENKKVKTCYCNKDLTVEEVKSLVKAVNGSESIWMHPNCNIDDKSCEGLTKQLNLMFRKYNINECIQKIAFLAMTSVETGFFQTAGEITGNTASSQYFYKGRGLLLYHG